VIAARSSAEYDVVVVRSSSEPKLIGPLARHGAPLVAPGGSLVFPSGDAGDDTLAAMARCLPVGRIGRTKDTADAIIALLRNGIISGTVLRADGGHRLVWSRDRLRGG
jgi:hypothetical protein